MAQEIADSKLLDTWSSSGTKIEPDISKIIEGWQLGEQPPHEYMNWLQNTFGSKLNHILKNGIAEWNNETEYLAGATTQHNGGIWICQETNVNSEPTELNSNWDKIPSLENLAITIDTINDFPTSARTGDVCIVKDLDRGGIFIYDSTKVSEDNQGTNFNGWIRQFSGAVNVKWFGMGEGGADCYTVAQKIFRNSEKDRKNIIVPSGYYQFSVFNPTNCNIYAEDAVFEFTHDTTKSVVMGQITDCYIEGLTFKSLEADLTNQKVVANNSELVECKFIGWRNPTSSNSWGLYLSDCGNVKVTRCGFADNTQADIAIVDNVRNVIIEQCYGLVDDFVINLEPNTSSSVNENIQINNMNIDLLMLLENGSGGTANKTVSVTDCNIDVLKYDGASCVFSNCKINSFSQETSIFFGKAKFINTLNLSPNLLKDPYFFTFSFNNEQAVNQNNYWRINLKNTVGQDYLSSGKEGGVRYTRVNPQNESKAINFINASNNQIPVYAGESFLICITGRSVTGATGAYFKTYDGVNEKLCRVFRQNNDGIPYFVTELGFVTVQADGFLPIIVGKYLDLPGTVDIVSVSVHKVLGNLVGGNEDTILYPIHQAKTIRVIDTDAVPTPSTVTVLNQYQKGDMVIPNNGNVSVWNGTSFVSIY